MSLEMRLGKRGNLLTPGPESYAQVLPSFLQYSVSAVPPVILTGVNMGMYACSHFTWCRGTTHR
jgi:hypothetical protein